MPSNTANIGPSGYNLTGNESRIQLPGMGENNSSSSESIPTLSVWKEKTKLEIYNKRSDKLKVVDLAIENWNKNKSSNNLLQIKNALIAWGTSRGGEFNPTSFKASKRNKKHGAIDSILRAFPDLLSNLDEQRDIARQNILDFISGLERNSFLTTGLLGIAGGASSAINVMSTPGAIQIIDPQKAFNNSFGKISGKISNNIDRNEISHGANGKTLLGNRTASLNDTIGEVNSLVSTTAPYVRDIGNNLNKKSSHTVSETSSNKAKVMKFIKGVIDSITSFLKKWWGEKDALAILNMMLKTAGALMDKFWAGVGSGIGAADCAQGLSSAFNAGKKFYEYSKTYKKSGNVQVRGGWTGNTLNIIKNSDLKDALWEMLNFLVSGAQVALRILTGGAATLIIAIKSLFVAIIKLILDWRRNNKIGEIINGAKTLLTKNTVTPLAFNKWYNDAVNSEPFFASLVFATRSYARNKDGLPNDQITDDIFLAEFRNDGMNIAHEANNDITDIYFKHLREKSKNIIKAQKPRLNHTTDAWNQHIASAYC